MAVYLFQCLSTAKYIWLITNDTEWVEGSPEMLIDAMESDPKVGMLHPSLTHDSPTGWRNMLNRGDRAFTYDWMIDIIAPVIRLDLWKKLGGFDENFSRGWGMDWDFCYRMYKAGYVGMVDHRVQMRHLLGGTYRTGNAPETDEARTMKAEDEAEKYMTNKYGGNWRDDVRLHNEMKIARYLGV